MTDELTFTTARGTATAAELRAAAPKQRKATRAPTRDAIHKGWAVEGHPPGALEAARASAQRSLDWWAAADAKKRSGLRQPKPFDEAQWLRNTKRKRVSRPYELRSAAETCKALAERAGWTHVVVRELSRGEAPHDFF